MPVLEKQFTGRTLYADDHERADPSSHINTLGLESYILRKGCVVEVDDSLGVYFDSIRRSGGVIEHD